MATLTRVPQCVAPRPAACGWCGGSGLENDEEAAEIPCLACGGAGVTPADFRLPAGRTHGFRRVRFDPRSGELVVSLAAADGRAARTSRYVVAEFAPGDGWEGRAFHVAKQPGRRGGDVELRNVFVGRTDEAGVSCDCEGQAYQGAAKANQAAWEVGEEVFFGFGCHHLDSVVSLLRGGWLDLDRSPAPA